MSASSLTGNCPRTLSGDPVRRFLDNLAQPTEREKRILAGMTPESRAAVECFFREIRGEAAAHAREKERVISASKQIAAAYDVLGRVPTLAALRPELRYTLRSLVAADCCQRYLACLLAKRKQCLKRLKGLRLAEGRRRARIRGGMRLSQSERREQVAAIDILLADDAANRKGSASAAARCAAVLKAQRRAYRELLTEFYLAYAVAFPGRRAANYKTVRHALGWELELAYLPRESPKSLVSKARRARPASTEPKSDHLSHR